MKPKQRRAFTILVITILLTAAVVMLSSLEFTHAYTLPDSSFQVTVPDGKTYTVNVPSSSVPLINGNGGYNAPSQGALPGLYEGYRLIDIIDAALALDGSGPLSSNQIQVLTSGGSGGSGAGSGPSNPIFNYDQVANGVDLNPQFPTFTPSGTQSTPPNPVTLLVAEGVYKSGAWSKLSNNLQGRLLIIGERE